MYVSFQASKRDVPDESKAWTAKDEKMKKMWKPTLFLYFRKRLIDWSKLLLSEHLKWENIEIFLSGRLKREYWDCFCQILISWGIFLCHITNIVCFRTDIRRQVFHSDGDCTITLVLKFVILKDGGRICGHRMANSRLGPCNYWCVRRHRKYSN